MHKYHFIINMDIQMNDKLISNSDVIQINLIFTLRYPTTFEKPNSQFWANVAVFFNYYLKDGKIKRYKTPLFSSYDHWMCIYC